MSNAVWFITFKLKKGVSEEDFLIASKKCHDEVLSRQKGFISWEVLRDGETWVDFVKWETPEDAENAQTAGASNPTAGRVLRLLEYDELQNADIYPRKNPHKIAVVCKRDKNAAEKFCLNFWRHNFCCFTAFGNPFGCPQGFRAADLAQMP